MGATKSVEEIREIIGADSLAYLSLDGLIKSVGLNKRPLHRMFQRAISFENAHDL